MKRQLAVEQFADLIEEASRKGYISDEKPVPAMERKLNALVCAEDIEALAPRAGELGLSIVVYLASHRLFQPVDMAEYRVNQVRELLRALTPEQRAKAFSEMCIHCYEPKPEGGFCTCMRDE